MSDTRNKVEFKSPESEGWAPEDLLQNVLLAIDNGVQKEVYGPFLVVFGPKWADHLEKKYYRRGIPVDYDKTVKERIEAVELVRKVLIGNDLQPFEVQVYALVN